MGRRFLMEDGQEHLVEIQDLNKNPRKAGETRGLLSARTSHKVAGLRICLDARMFMCLNLGRFGFYP